MGTIGVHWSLDGTLVVHGCLLSTTEGYLGSTGLHMSPKGL